MTPGTNWIANNISASQTKDAKAILEKYKKERYGKKKKYKLVKISNNPLTFREVEVL